MDVDFGLLGVLLAAEVAAMLLAAFVIGAVLRWVSDWKHGQSRSRKASRPAREIIDDAARR